MIMPIAPGHSPRDACPDRWRLYRRLYNLGRLVLFLAVAYFGAHMMMFHTFGWFSTADYTDIVRQSCVSAVIATKEYQRDHGQLPTTIQDLIPNYLPLSCSPTCTESEPLVFGNWDDITFAGNVMEFRWRNDEVFSYDLSPEHEVFSVFSMYSTGPGPFPPVIAPRHAPPSAPAANPTTD
jgi:hypothetical protein